MTADDVACAIVAASREVGADPIDVLCGYPTGGTDRDKSQATSRARVYAAYALDKVFNEVARPRIALMVGCSFKSKDSYFSSFEGRKATCRWWDDAVLHRVIAAVVVGVADGMSGITPELRGVPPNRTEPAPMTPHKAPPYRPPPGTYEKHLNDLDDDDRPVFDRGGIAERKPWVPPARDSRQQMRDDLAEAVANTAKLPVPEE